MSVKKFKFISPGIFLNEIDNSQLPKAPLDIGPMIIGRTRKGPGFKPTLVENFSEFVENFGNPVDGTETTDLWRRAGGSAIAPTYAAYAAQAWLGNQSPATIVRLLGRQHANAVAAGKAGWWTNQVGTTTTHTSVGTADTDGGAYGLFLINSSSNDKIIGAGADTTPQNGCLAAVFYLDQGNIALSGALRGIDSEGGAGAPDNVTGSSALFRSSDADKGFFILIKDKDGNDVESVRFNFNRNSSKYIRKVFNTNPTLTNQDITNTAQQKTYFLGETFDRAVADKITNSAAGTVFGMLVGLEQSDSDNSSYSNFRYGAQAAKTPWIRPQHVGDHTAMNPSTLPKLFRFCSHLGGQHDMHSLKISIKDIKASTSDINPYGTFTVLVRSISDTDKRPVVLERFSGLNLNPASPDYIKRRIGDRYHAFDSTARRNRAYGEYENKSRYFRVEMDEDLDGGALSEALLPFGFYTPPKPVGFTVHGTGSHDNVANAAHGINIYPSGTLTVTLDSPAQLADANRWVKGIGEASNALKHNTHKANIINVGYTKAAAHDSHLFTGSFEYPTIALREKSDNGGFSKASDPYWGFHTGKSISDLSFDESNYDLMKPLPSAFNSLTFDGNGTQMEHRIFFTLDDLVGTGTSVSVNPAKGEHATWTSGSLLAGSSISAKSTGNNGGYKAVLRAGHNKFTVPVHGGFDGLNIKEKDPFRNSQWSAGSTTMENNYAYNSVMEALDIVTSPEDAEYNLLATPGVVFSQLTDKAMEIAEQRGDALAVVDIPNVYTPKSENKATFANRLGSVQTAVDSLNDRQVNNNYACTYYPWVQIRDVIHGSLVWTPPSVAALGAMAYSDSRSEPWFAPAGFNRGGLSNGSAGVPVVNVTEKLSSSDRDDLYDARINPIASFPAEGIVIFGQKTLQIGQSALDRINVRRLMILIKKQISRMASRVLFDQNVQVTWNRFLSMVEPFLRSVKTRLGLTDFKVVLDNTTTTPDLIDRNIMYAKIFLKPARSIEYIAIDFNITRSGASFED